MPTIPPASPTATAHPPVRPHRQRRSGHRVQPGDRAGPGARTPAGRWGRPDELVGTVLFLAAPASDFVNGQIIYVDGGVLAAI